MEFSETRLSGRMDGVSPDNERTLKGLTMLDSRCIINVMSCLTSRHIQCLYPKLHGNFVYVNPSGEHEDGYQTKGEVM